MESAKKIAERALVALGVEFFISGTGNFGTGGGNLQKKVGVDHFGLGKKKGKKEKSYL
ncbi:hypothetical protein [Leptospira interrogans]|uniref:hypothetical protein n=1 Tax=Leptospira interrogans TaxID=173 RepID=UPI003527CADA